MPRIDLTLETDIQRSAKVIQVEGMFDVPSEKRRTVDFHFDMPIEERDWQIGLITGPSGSGKSTVINHVFKDHIVADYKWPNRQSVLDGFGKMPIRKVIGALSSVGFSSPPSWTKPYKILSNGEKFRATLARAIVDDRKLIVMDEFTSVVDRTVAKVGSYAVSKAIRKTPGKQFIAVSCHSDIVKWLQPDWILEPHIGVFRWRSLRRRPLFKLEIVRCDYSAWKWFAKHHYLTSELNSAAICFVGLIKNEPVVFAGILNMMHPRKKNIKSLSRLVVMPDYQGLGLGSKHFIEDIARILHTTGYRFIAGPANPVLIHNWAKSSNWKMIGTNRLGIEKNTRESIIGKYHKQDGRHKTFSAKHSMYRRVASFRWVGGGYTDPEKIEQSKRLMAKM